MCKTILVFIYFKKCSDTVIRYTNSVQVFFYPNIPLLVDSFVEVIHPVSYLAFPVIKYILIFS